MARMRFTILGCGSSGGVPRLGGLWGACDPDNPRNHRRRCSLLVERLDGDASTRVLIDASPDLRAQLLDAGVGLLDGVVFTHAHADHVHGLDDLRMIVFNRKSRLSVWADAPTSDALINRFSYAFTQPEGSPYPAILEINPIDGPVSVPGGAGPILFEPFEVGHGSSTSLGFRVGKLAYLPDVSHIPETTWPRLENLEVFILDALRYLPHPTHTHLSQSLEWIERANPRRAVITNMHIDLDYQTVDGETPNNVTPAHDGMVIELDG